MYNFIEWKSLEFKKAQGTEKVKCPVCDKSKQRAGDTPIQINHADGYGKCFRCESLTFKESKKNDYTEKVYVVPSQEWKNYTNISDKLIKFIESERGIKQSTLLNLGVTEEKYYQPAKQKEVNNIVFNYFEGETIVNKKYRTSDKKFTQSKGGKPIFYNINSVIDSEEVYIVEGEFDVLALHDYGIKNCISVPNGANDNDDYWKNSEKYLKNVKKFIIALDNDEKGNDLIEKVAQRLGRYRCEFIEWKNKDANGDLISGDIESSLNSRRKFPVSGTFQVEDMYSDILGLYDNGLPDTLSPQHPCFGNLKKVFSVMRGQLSVITGIPSHGKSNYSEWHVLNMVKDYNMKTSFFSPEHTPMHLHQTNFIQKAIGKNFWKESEGVPRITKEDIARYKEWANERIYLTAPESGEYPTWDWLFEKFKEQVYSFGIDIFVIDAFNKLELPAGESRDQINKVLTKLTMFAQMNNVVVFLVAHPTKMKKQENGTYECPTLYDVSGSSDFRNQTHNGFGIYRHFENEEISESGYTEFVNLKTKMSFQGEIGQKVEFDYHIPTGRYYAKGTAIPSFDMTMNEDYKKIEAIQPNTDFDLSEDEQSLPF